MVSKSRRPKNNEGLSWTAFKSEWQSWFASKGPVLQFGLKFGLLMAAFYALLLLPACERLLLSYLEANARLANAILKGLGQDSHLSGVTISSSRFSMAIRRGCDAVEPTWLFCAAVLSYPAPLMRKMIGILVSIILLQLLNIARVVSLYYIGVYLPAFFNTAHLEIWPTMFILVAILLMVGWIEWAKNDEPAT